MSLSWGRRSDNGRRPPWWALGLAAGIAALGALLWNERMPDKPPEMPEPVMEETGPELDERARRAIQRLLDAHLLALVQQQVSPYVRTIDPGSVAFRRCMGERFHIGEVRATRLAPFRMVDAWEVAPSLVRIHVQQRDGISVRYARYVRDPLFRTKAVHHWVLSQPTLAELGARRERTLDGLVLSYWELDEALSEVVAREMVTARDLAARHPPSPPAVGPSGRFQTRSDALPGISCLTAGRYDARAVQIVLKRYLLDPSGSGLADLTRMILLHEALHWVQWSTGDMTAVDWWLAEGGASHLAQMEPRRDNLRTHGCTVDGTALPSVQDLVDGPRNMPGRRVLFLYDVAHSLMAYVHEAHGGGPAYWRVVAAQRSGLGRAEAYELGFGVGLERLYADWSARFRATYC